MKTYVLIQTEPRGLDAQLAEELASVQGVQRVLHVEGPFDVVAEVDGHDASTEEAVPRISRVHGVLRAIPLHVVGEGNGRLAASIDIRSVEDVQMEPCNAVSDDRQTDDRRIGSLRRRTRL